MIDVARAETDAEPYMNNIYIYVYIHTIYICMYICIRIYKRVTRATAGKWVTVPPLLELKLMFFGSFSSFTHVWPCFDLCDLPLNGVYPQRTLVGIRVPCSQCSQSLVHQTSCRSSDFPTVHFEGDRLFLFDDFTPWNHHVWSIFGTLFQPSKSRKCSV